jgi:LacI family transcriptional regulator/LacI family purine nucleotide synthesis repressor
MQDIAGFLGISKNAVSLALNNKPGVSEDLRKMVFKAAEEMNYGGFQQKRKSNNIIVLIPEYISNDTYFYNDIYWSIEKEAKLRGYNAILSSVSAEMENALQLPNIYFEMDFRGIMIIGIFDKKYVEKLVGLGLPLLSVDHYYDEIILDSIVTANEEGAYTAVKYLIDNGHRDIGYIGSIDMTASLYERWNGYLKAMRKNNLEVNMKHCITKPSSLSHLLNDIEELEKSINEMDTFPTAWFCGGDRIAIALVNVLSRRSIKVPEDISVMGFDDIQASSIIVPALTTFKVKREIMGREAVDRLVKKIDEGGDKLKLAIYGELVVRNSVKKI